MSGILPVSLDYRDLHPIHYVLRRRGLAHRIVPPVSLVLAARSNTYVRALNAFAQGELSKWLDVFGRALLPADGLCFVKRNYPSPH